MSHQHQKGIGYLLTFRVTTILGKLHCESKRHHNLVIVNIYLPKGLYRYRLIYFHWAHSVHVLVLLRADVGVIETSVTLNATIVAVAESFYTVT